MDHELPPREPHDLLAEAYRRERRAFWWACGWVGVIGLTLIAREGLLFWKKLQLEQMIAASVPVEEILHYAERGPVAIYPVVYLMLGSPVGLILAVGLWIRAIHDRRRLEASSLSGGAFKS